MGGRHDKEFEGHTSTNYSVQNQGTERSLASFLDTIDIEPLSSLPSAPQVLPSRIFSLASDRHDQKILAVDFDNTIVEYDWKNHVITGIISGAKEKLEQLKKDGWKIVIHSHRVEHENGINEIIKTLDDNKIPFDEIFPRKPWARFYIDDHAIQFKNWDDTYNMINKNAKIIPVIT